MQFASPEKCIIFDSYRNSFLTSYILNFFSKQPQDFAYGSQPTNSFDYSAQPAILIGNFAAAGISCLHIYKPKNRKESKPVLIITYFLLNSQTMMLRSLPRLKDKSCFG